MKTKSPLPYKRKKKSLDKENATQKNVLVLQSEGSILEKHVTRAPVNMKQPSPSWPLSTSSNENRQPGQVGQRAGS